MIQLFTDQCRSTISHQSRFGLLALWLRTIVDLCKTALIEHFSSPQAKVAFFQASPGTPLPWKGVLLVAIPGLVIFISQVGQLAGKDWYYRTLAWAGYAFIVPVLLVWWRARKFPVWGLIPMGLILQQFSVLLPDLLMRLYGWLAGSPLGNLLKPLADFPIIGNRTLLVPLIFLTVLVVVGWLIARRWKFSGAAKGWLGIYILMLIGKMAMDVALILWNSLQFIPINHRFDGRIIRAVFNTQLSYISGQCIYDAYLGIFLLLLILLSVLLARRHGTLAFLLLLGYLLPTIVSGSTSWAISGSYFLLVGGMVFIYRVSIAIIAPLWIVRASSRKQQEWAFMIPVVIALAAQIILPFALRSEVTPVEYILLSLRGEATPLEYILRPILNGVIFLVGSALALTLYRFTSPEPQDKDLAVSMR
jgi:hypothetical protein